MCFTDTFMAPRRVFSRPAGCPLCPSGLVMVSELAVIPVVSCASVHQNVSPCVLPCVRCSICAVVARRCMMISKPYGCRLNVSLSFACVCPVTLPMVYYDYYCQKQYYYYYAWCKHECYNSFAHSSFATRSNTRGRKHYLGNIPSSCTCTRGTIEGGTCSPANVARTCAFRAFFDRMVAMVEVRARPRVEAPE